MTKIGDSIPDLELEAFLGDRIEKVRLTDYRDQWLVLLFYPSDFTYVCPTELREAAELYEKFKELGAEIVSVSTDSAFVHKSWHDSSKAVGKVRFPMLADRSGKLCREFGTYIEDEGLSLRATFIVDPKGVVKLIEMHDEAIGRNVGEILRKLQALKYVSDNPDSVCPASWKPGAEVLKPKFDLIGGL